MISPLASTPLFQIGGVGIAESVVATWGIMVALGLGAIVVNRTLSLSPSSVQAVMEMLVDTVDSQIRDTMAVAPAPYRAFIGTLFVYGHLEKYPSPTRVQ
jgi:F-type H+-transporting ATPase subunit a